MLHYLPIMSETFLSLTEVLSNRYYARERETSPGIL